MLPTGKVLAAAGYNGSTWLKTAELYDPVAGTWASTGSLNAARAGAGAVLLSNGSVLLAAGYDGNSYLTSAELYNPASGTWALTGNLNTARNSTRPVLLSNGKALVVGGVNSSGTLAGAELYSPESGTWTVTGSLSSARQQHTAVTLPNGKVLVAGGIGTSGYLASAELYDPSTGTWSVTGNLVGKREYHTATLLPNGMVLVAGGYNAAYVATAELYDPGTGTWTATGALSTARYGHTATLLPDGRVLVAGGTGSSGYLSSAELYDPASGTWSAAATLSNARSAASSTVLLSGKVLIAGGNNSTYPTSTELFDRGLGSTANGAPQISSAPPTFALVNSLVLAGTGFRGIGAASSGNVQDSASNYPLVQLRALENGQSIFVLANSSANWSDVSFSSIVLDNLPFGYAMATVFTNGIPSNSVLLDIGPSNQATLSNLALNVGTLTPAFSSVTTSYTANVSPATGTTIVTPTCADTNASVVVNGTTVISGTASPPINLVMGNNTINTVVTAQDGITSLTYSTIVTRLTPLQNWRLTYFGMTANSGVAADSYDYCGNGLPNLMKYAFGLDPTIAASSQLPQPVWDGNTLTNSFPAAAGVSGITYGAEWTESLNPPNWQPINDTGSGGTHTFSITVAGHPSLFMRLKISEP
jgi:N-acetylneuraminic acid mutarotase